MNDKKVNLRVAGFALMAALLLPVSAFALDPQHRGSHDNHGHSQNQGARKHDRVHDRLERRHDRFHDRSGDRNNRRHRAFHREARQDHREFHDHRRGNDQRRFDRRW